MTDRTKVAIIGKAPASIPRAPFADESWEIWSLSDAYRQIPRWDRWFELHDLEWHREQHPEHWAFLTTDHSKPLYILHPHKDIPHATIYPRDDVFRQLGKFRYFTNSISYMIALAIVEGFTSIGIYGVDMAQHDEYAHQRPSCEYWVGYAAGMGIEIDIPEESDLMKCRKLYGYETHYGDMYRKVRARDAELGERIALTERQKEQMEKQAQWAFGGLALIEQLTPRLNGQGTAVLSEAKMQLDAQYRSASGAIQQANEQAWMLRGAKEDLQWARQWC